MIITAHILLKNEARFAWYSIMSVINFVDRIRIWDMGSTDGTIEIVEEVLKTEWAKEKEMVQFKKLNPDFFDEPKVRQGMVESEHPEILMSDMKESGFWYARQKMLDVTTSDWFIVVDGDEIWWDDSIRRLTDSIRKNGTKLESIVVPTINLVGDMFHYQEKLAGRYHLARRIGHYNLRAINRKIPGLFSFGVHGVSGWMDREGNLIQNRNQKKVLYLDSPYLHATHLQRSLGREGDNLVFKRARKLKYELGFPVPADFYYPEVFFRSRPKIVPSPWQVMGSLYKFRAFFETPLRKAHRRTFLKFKKHGY